MSFRQLNKIFFYFQADKSILKAKKSVKRSKTTKKRGGAGGDKGSGVPGGGGANKWDNFKKDVGKLQIEIDSDTELAL